ncbi:MAG TPA: hypothetical protein VHO50_01995 [Bacteroidales bacterium]|nr:hypothetical protein [Bacteroidales bacterium]
MGLRKIITYLFLFLVVVAGLLLVFRNTSPFGSKNTSFSIQQEKEITRIELSNNKTKLTIADEGDKWLLNGQKETRKSSISFIIRLLYELEIKSPVSQEVFKDEISDKGIEPVRVRVYEKRRLINDFFVYKTRSNAYGNIMKKKTGSKPFIVHVPGHDGDIGSAFTLNELYWQPYTIFNLLPSEISSIRAENPDSSDSFTINHRKNIVELTDNKSELTGFDTVLVRRYISYFTYIPFESWALELSNDMKNEILSKTPTFRISVLTFSGHSINLSLWEKMNDDGSIDTDRIYGKVDDKEQIFIARYFDLDPILKKREYFFKKYPENSPAK